MKVICLYRQNSIFLKKHPVTHRDRVLLQLLFMLRYDTSIMENTMTNSATVSPTPKTIR